MRPTASRSRCFRRRRACTASGSSRPNRDPASTWARRPSSADGCSTTARLARASPPTSGSTQMLKDALRGGSTVSLSIITTFADPRFGLRTVLNLGLRLDGQEARAGRRHLNRGCRPDWPRWRAGPREAEDAVGDAEPPVLAGPDLGRGAQGRRRGAPGGSRSSRRGRASPWRLAPQPFDARTKTVVYAVIAANANELPSKLPFFSRLNLWQARRFLAMTLDYQVEFLGIPFA